MSRLDRLTHRQLMGVAREKAQVIQRRQDLEREGFCVGLSLLERDEAGD
jgi:hypothetical protein